MPDGRSARMLFSDFAADSLGSWNGKLAGAKNNHDRRSHGEEENERYEIGQAVRDPLSVERVNFA
jgi:hypothetical protein